MAQIGLPLRFDGWSRGWALAVLAFIALVTVASALTPPIKEPPAKYWANAKLTDPMLYSQVAARVGNGDSYYTAAAELHREGGFPLKPFVTMRLPTLAYLTGYLGSKASFVLFLALIGAVVVGWMRAAIQGGLSKPMTIALCGLIGMSCAILINPITSVLHDAWAGLLIALALALWREGRFWPSLIVGLAAALIRENAAAFLLLMGAAAAIEQRWREVLCWAGAVAIMIVVLKLHHDAVALVVRDDDIVSSGWQAHGGWPMLVIATKFCTPLLLLPRWLAAFLLPLALFGWASWKHPLALRVTGLLLGYGAMIMLFARVQNFYWALLMAPLLLGGLALVPRAFARLIMMSRQPRAAFA